MDPGITRQFPYFLFVLALFLIYGALVRRGVLTGRGILWGGAAFGLVAVAASVLNARSVGAPLLIVIYNAVLMTGTAAFCIWFSYRAQRVEDLAVYTLGDTKVIVRQSPASQMPDADVLLLPTTTSLLLLGGIPGIIGLAAGPEVEKEAQQSAPVGFEKVVATSAGKLPVGRILHVAVNERMKPVDVGRLKRGMAHAALEARKLEAESLAVLVGTYAALNAERMAEATAEGVLRQRKAFAEIVFIVLESRDSRAALTGISRAMEAIEPGSTGNSGISPGATKREPTHGR